MLLALHILLDTLAPAENAPGVRVFMNAITGDPVLCIFYRRRRHLGGAFQRRQRAPGDVAGLRAFHLARRRRWRWCSAPISAAPSIRCSRARAATTPRAIACRSAISSTGWPACCWWRRSCVRSPKLLQAWQPDLAKATAEFHIAFNVATAIIFIGLLDGMARLLKKLLPNRVQETDPSRPRYLDESALETPSLALADAARETLHMGDHVEIMLRKVMAAMMTNDRALVDQVSRMDNSVDSLDEAIKLYVTKLTRGSLDEREGQRAMEIISFAINLEHIGDIIDKNLSELATKKIKRRFQFSPEGAEELSAFHKRTMDSLRIAFGVFMSGDVNEARKLLAEKAPLRNTELAATERHLDRLREGRPESIETTSLHLDVLRDLRRIHSHICSVAYPVLDAAGELAAYARPSTSWPRSPTAWRRQRRDRFL